MDSTTVSILRRRFCEWWDEKLGDVQAKDKTYRITAPEFEG
jgi:hypothetical protein